MSIDISKISKSIPLSATNAQLPFKRRPLSQYIIEATLEKNPSNVRSVECLSLVRKIRKFMSKDTKAACRTSARCAT